MNDKTRVGYFLGFALLLLVVVLFCLPSVREGAQHLFAIIISGDYQQLIAFLRSFGYTGMVILFCLQLLQTLIPFPESILQITAGIAYGPWWGTLILMVSYTLGNVTIFILLRHFQPAFLKWIQSLKPVQKCHRLLGQQKPEVVVFILYLFPFLSNCFVPYLVAHTSISLRKYFAIMVIACLPMMLACVYLGDRLAEQDWLTATVVFLLCLIVSLILYFSQNWLWQQLKKLNTKFEQKR
ncbi:VTT domain-containing protein [bacterium]|nr:VTT domain-containing protein [bacterium]